MIRRLLVILPPPALLLALALAYTLMELPLWIVRLRWGAQAMGTSRPALVIVVLSALAYGVYRVAAFHPFFRPDYRAWLERAPWTSRKPLPVGPVAWIPEDLLILGVFALLTSISEHPGAHPVVVATLPLLSYAVVLSVSLFATGTSAFGYALAFALGLAVWLGPNRWALLAAAVGVNLIGWVGLQRSLARFPWALERQEAMWESFREALGEKRSDWQYRCGWPYDRLLRDPAEPLRIGQADALLISMLAGWWLFALTSLIPDPRDRDLFRIMAVIVGSGGFGAFRLLLYCAGYASPISLWGRIVTFRWIVPGYDQVFVGPIGTFLTGSLGIGAFLTWRWPGDAALPACFALTLFVALSCPPSLKHWRLTGQHRLVFGVQQKQKNEFIQVG
jgi:hypothetical protein